MRKDELIVVIGGIAVVLIISFIVQQPSLSLSLPWNLNEEGNSIPDIPLETPTVPGHIIIPSRQPTQVVSQLPVEHTGVARPDPPETIELQKSDTVEVYSWYYLGSFYTWTIHIPASRYNYFASLPRDKPTPADYIMSDRGRGELDLVIEDLISLAASRDLNENERRDMVIAFVQSLPNNHWGAVRDYDDYPKYPLQTLYDGGGDSQDTAILLTALLRLLGIEASLIETPRHYAVVLPLTEADKNADKVYLYQKDADTILKGNYLDQDNTIRDYYHNNPAVLKNSYIYIESNIPGHPMGSLPPQFKNAFVMSLYDKNYRPEVPISGAVIHHPVRNPDADLSFRARLIYYDQRYAYYQVYCTIVSTGTGPAGDFTVDITAFPADGTDVSWTFSESISIPPVPEGETRVVEGTVQIPRNAEVQIACILRGPGIEQKKRLSEIFTT
jgi:transglutaminase-like putative cysteine protease